MNNNYVPLLHFINIISDGKYYSYQDLTQRLNINLSTFKKYQLSLETLGLTLLLDNEGCHLQTPIYLLNIEEILLHLNQKRLFLKPIIDSTNQYLIKHLPNLISGDTCVAEYQYAGRGRRGRQWVSPFGQNLYFSLYWALKKSPDSIKGLSICLGISLAQVLKMQGYSSIKIKWPNDLTINDKKLGGILVEIIKTEKNLTHIIIGIGINIFMKSDDKIKIEQDWINLQEITNKPINRNILIAKMINQLRENLPIFEQNGLKEFIKNWSSFDSLLHRNVKILSGKKEIYGTAIGINANGQFLLSQSEKVTSWADGEVSLRLV